TLIAEGKEVKEFDGEKYIMERGLFADLAIVHAWKGDTAGNLVYRKTARNFNPMMATAAKITIAEVEHLVPAGEIDPDHVHTPGIFVKRMVEVGTGKKRIEFRNTRPRAASSPAAATGVEICWPGPANKWLPAPPRNCATATMSISASAFRHWCRTISARVCT